MQNKLFMFIILDKILIFPVFLPLVWNMMKTNLLCSDPAERWTVGIKVENL